MLHPTVRLESLSEDAQLLYRRSVGEHTTGLTLDRDWFHPQAHRMSNHAFRPEMQLDPDFAPSERLLAAVGELTAYGYAWHSHGNRFGMLRVDPKVYTIATGQGDWGVRVSRVSRPGMPNTDGSMLAVLQRADLVTHDEATIRELHLKVRVPGARDMEHDPAYAASITVQLPTFPQIAGPHMVFWGIAEKTHLYPLGTEPTHLDDRTYEPIEEPVRCGSEYCVDDPHVFAPYLPPEIDLGRAVLCVETRIRRGEEG